jgi:hypothetical protein
MAPLCPKQGKRMDKEICTYCGKEAWGKYLKRKGSKLTPYHTFCLVRMRRAGGMRRMPGGVSQ